MIEWHWRATYDDGSVLEEGPGAYARLDRLRLRRFTVYPHRLAPSPVLDVEVHPGRRLVARTRGQAQLFGNAPPVHTLMVALERADRSAEVVYLLTEDPPGIVRRSAQRDYGAGVSLRPDLHPEEM